MAEVMCKAEKIAVIHDTLYHWRVEREQNSSTNQGGKRLLIMPEQCEEVKKIVKENGLYESLKEELYLHFFSTNYLFFNTIKLEFQRKYFDKFRALFAELENDKTFMYKYFTKREQKIIKRLLAGKYWILSIKNIRHSIFKFRWKKNERLIKIAGKILYQK